MNLESKVINWSVFPIFCMVEIWDALRAAAEADLTLAQAIVDSAGVIVQSSDLTVCYDERGTRTWLVLLFFSFYISTQQAFNIKKDILVWIFQILFATILTYLSVFLISSSNVLQEPNMNCPSMFWVSQLTWFVRVHNERKWLVGMWM